MKPKEEWTRCTYFKCVMNTGWAAGDDKYLCIAGLNMKTCGAIPHPPKSQK